MRIAHIVPEAKDIPPRGWGGVGGAVWNLSKALEKRGHEVLIVNARGHKETFAAIADFRPQFVHLHTDVQVHWLRDITVPCAVSSQFPYIDQPAFYTANYARSAVEYCKYAPNTFCVSQRILDTYRNLNAIPGHRLFLTPNGVDASQFEVSDTPRYPERSIYLAQVHWRKRQHLFQDIPCLWFAGGLKGDGGTFRQTERYLGEWYKDTLFSSLTHYGNLVLLSRGEAHALVCMEALSAGLGVIVSEWASANLDTSKPFISVVPEARIRDLGFVRETIEKNREYSLAHRAEIREYARQFETDAIVDRCYLPSVNKVVQGQPPATGKISLERRIRAGALHTYLRALRARRLVAERLGLGN